MLFIHSCYEYNARAFDSNLNITVKRELYIEPANQ